MTRIISGFPGVGKSYLAQNTNKIVIDSNSSSFSCDDKLFPDNYMEHIKKLQHPETTCDLILVSTHERVRQGLVDRDMQFTLVYPSIELKAEYLQRFADRGCVDNFIDFMEKNWEVFIEQLQAQEGCGRIVLGEGMFLSDIIK